MTESKSDATTLSQPQPHEPQPAPLANRPDQPDVVDLVCQDLRDRADTGELKYGCRLQPFNGRDALTDAYQEALDQSNYLRQAIHEKEVLCEDLRGLVEGAQDLQCIALYPCEKTGRAHCHSCGIKFGLLAVYEKLAGSST